MLAPRLPFVCPVCLGRGQKERAFYSAFQTTTALGLDPVPCRSCAGTGVVWAPGELTLRQPWTYESGPAGGIVNSTGYVPPDSAVTIRCGLGPL